MITTSSFPNLATSAQDNNIKRNSLTKEDLEGEVKRNIIINPLNKNGGIYQYIKLD